LPLADPMARRPHVLHPRRGVEPFAGACFKEDRADAGGGVGVVWRARVGARASQRRRCRCSTTRPSGSAMARPAAPRHPARDSRRAPRRRERRQWPGRTVPTHCRPVWDRARTTELVRPHRLAARSMVACYSSQDTVSSAATVSVSCVSISTWPGRSTVTVIPGGGRGQHPASGPSDRHRCRSASWRDEIGEAAPRRMDDPDSAERTTLVTITCHRRDRG